MLPVSVEALKNTHFITSSGSMVAPRFVPLLWNTGTSLICWDFHDSQHTPMIK